MTRKLAILSLIAAVVAGLIATSTALADRSYRTKMKMAESKQSFPSVWADGYIYTFGGWGFPGHGGGFIDAISRIDPVISITEVLGARLPTRTRGAAAFYDGEYIWVLGGRDSSGYLDRIVRYDPSSDTIETLPTRLPFKDELLTAVWTGEYAYIVGGWFGTHRGVTRFDPSSGIAQSTGAQLPSGNQIGTAAAYDGQRYIYVTNVNAETGHKISRYDTLTNEVKVLGATLPHGWGVSAVWADSAMYVFGGHKYNGWFQDFYDTIARYDPETDTVTEMYAKLPSGRAFSSAVNTPYGIYVLGGNGYHPTWEPADFWTCGDAWCLSPLDEVVRYDPTPSAPRVVSAIPSLTAPGTVELTWSPPQRDSFGTALISYRIYRLDASGEKVIATVPGDQTSYKDTSCLGACTYSIAATNATGEGPKSSSVISAGAGNLERGVQRDGERA